MSTPEHSPPASPDDWITICERELANVGGAYNAKLSNDTKIDHAILATEAVLKAIIWKNRRWDTWPRPRKGLKYLFNHDLEPMLEQSGYRPRLRADQNRLASWRVLLNAGVKKYRYSPMSPSDDEANAVARSARHPDFGVVPWLLECYREMS